MPLQVEIKTTRETHEVLKNMPGAIRDGLIKGMKETMEFAENKAKKSFGKSGKPGNITYRLRDSIKASSKVQGSLLVGSIGSDRVYARIHEEGGVIRAKGGYLRFQIGGSWRSVRSVRIPRREYLKPAIQDNLNKINQILTDSVWEHFERI